MLHTQRLFTPKGVNLKLKLHSSLKYVLNTCVLKSHNKIKDIEDTNGWSLFQQYRYNVPGQYRKVDKHPFTPKDLFTNAIFDSQKRLFFYQNKNWYYHTSYFDEATYPAPNLVCRNNQINPLDDPEFQLHKSHKKLLNNALLIIEKKQGNCLDRLILLAKYLWENSTGIKRIEIVPTTSFDHCLLIVNRSGQLDDSDTWEDAWVIDAWYQEDGLVFPAAEFSEKIKHIKQFAKEQQKEVQKIGIYSTNTINKNEEEKLRTSYIDIDPLINQYPTYSTSPFYPVEYYYYVSNSYPNNDIPSLLNDLNSHKEKFKACLTSLSTL